MNQRQSQSWIFSLAAQMVKYFFLSLVSCMLTYVISITLSLDYFSIFLIRIFLHGLSRAGVVILCIVAIAVITESLRDKN